MSSVYVLNAVCSHIKRNKVVGIVADNTIGIIMFHQQIVMLMLLILHNRCNVYLLAAANLIVSIAISVLMAIVLGKNNIQRYWLEDSEGHLIGFRFNRCA